ncbi:MAG: hypothetical protein HUU16_03650 [Candidatus Omnitrophica bacterium]|nr:hypothetical protein [bacterium]NUN95247.1 hypothetical protein [Candidatus Omnitrophota bacterium]
MRITHSFLILALVLQWARIPSAVSEEAAPVTRARSLQVFLADPPTEQERMCAELLVNRIQKRSRIEAQVHALGEKSARSADLLVILGNASEHESLATTCQEASVKLPTPKDPGPEGFVIDFMIRDGKPTVVAIGVDKLGTLYAVGEILRRISYGETEILTGPMSIRTAPAYRWRGSSANQGGTMREMTGARGWTSEETHDANLEHALSGANTIYAYGADVIWAKKWGIKVERGVRPNQLLKQEIPPEWRKKETERGEYVCPSVPAARAALIAHYTQAFAEKDDVDVLRFFAGDPGGCRCEQCKPWGKTFMELCAELSEIWKRTHPDCEVQIANQDLDNAGDEALFEYLNAKPHSWLNSLSYGPGSNAMSSYFRSELREDLFIYPGHGPINRYLAYTLQNLPKDVSIVHYSDITHWISAQYEVTRPDPLIALIYGRRTFHQRPRAFYDIFQKIMPFSEGDIIYSEGYHDELHQYLWNRLLWNPNRSLEDLLTEHATYHFGAEAAPEMIQASLQLESSLETPLESNPGVERYRELVVSAGSKIPKNLLAVDHRWRLHLQKASLDRYLQLKIRREKELWDTAASFLAGRQDLAKAVQEASTAIHLPVETEEMKALRVEAEREAEESNRLFGVMNEAIRRTGMDLTGLEWTRSRVRAALAASDSERKAIVEELLGYEDPGEGGFYDDAGADGRQPHRVEGENLWNPAQFLHLLDPANRPTANSFAYNREGPVAFEYRGLDPNSEYKLRATLVSLKVTPQLAQRFGVDPSKIRRTEDILADDAILAKDLEVPQYTAKQVEFHIPKEVTRDGKVRIAFDAHPEPGSFGASVVSEVWLMKR